MPARVAQRLEVPPPAVKKGAAARQPETEPPAEKPEAFEQALSKAQAPPQKKTAPAAKTAPSRSQARRARGSNDEPSPEKPARKHGRAEPGAQTTADDLAQDQPVAEHEPSARAQSHAPEIAQEVLTSAAAISAPPPAANTAAPQTSLSSSTPATPVPPALTGAQAPDSPSTARPDPVLPQSPAELEDIAAPAIQPQLDDARPAPSPAPDTPQAPSHNLATPHPTSSSTAPAPALHQASPTPESQFIESNHPTIVSSIRMHLLPTGGSMNMRLDPPDLGPLQVHVDFRDGALSASFQTASDDATRLLSHSLSQLKQALESQGVAVDKLQVQQLPPQERASAEHDDQQQRQFQRQQSDQQQQQQQNELFRRMRRKLAGREDEVDVMA